MELTSLLCNLFKGTWSLPYVRSTVVPTTPGRTNQTLTGKELNLSQAHKKDRSPPIPLVTLQSLKELLEIEAKEVESKVEFEEEIEEEEENNPRHFDNFPTMKELRYHEWLLKNPRPPWVKAKIRTGNLNNVKFSCMIGHFDKKQAYLDMESPIIVMSRLHYNWIMNNRLEPGRKPSNPKKICNFVGRVKGLKVFIGNFTYECDFMVLEDTTSVIDHDLGSVIFGKLFVETTGLMYNMKEGTVVFEKDKEKMVFKLPHKMEMKFFKEKEKKIFSEIGDGVRIYPDGGVIFDEKKLGSS
ncbi:hypothetical protein Tco_1360441 [Tanacetum coccineum]